MINFNHSGWRWSSTQRAPRWVPRTCPRCFRQLYLLKVETPPRRTWRGTQVRVREEGIKKILTVFGVCVGAKAVTFNTRAELNTVLFKTCQTPAWDEAAFLAMRNSRLI